VGTVIDVLSLCNLAHVYRSFDATAAPFTL